MHRKHSDAHDGRETTETGCQALEQAKELGMEAKTMDCQEVPVAEPQVLRSNNTFWLLSGQNLPNHAIPNSAPAGGLPCNNQVKMSALPGAW